MLHRRDAMLRLGQLGGTLALPGLLAGRAAAAQAGGGRVAAGQGSAKSCILIYLWGGPPQQDMWDLKPDAPDGIRSLFAPIDTNVPGVQICDQLPHLSRQMDKLAIVRSLTHGSNVHEPSVYHTLTGRIDPTMVIPRNQRSRTNNPCPGAVVSYFTPPGPLPAHVTVPRPIGHDGIIYAGTHAGFLGARHDPLELAAPGEVNEKPLHDLSLPEGLDDARVLRRFGLLETLAARERALEQTRDTASLGEFRDQAFRMLAAPETKSAFQLDRESDALRDRYGRNQYGESMLLARRLIEAGVKLVTVVWEYICPDGNVANVWDNHGGTGSLGGITGFEMLKAPYCLPSLDLGLSALLEDLAQRGLLDETLVAAYGEFGRTPKINSAGGRDHWGACQSAVLAGGGIRGGQIYGASDAQAAYPRQHPVAPEDLLATLFSALGISPESTLYDQQNRPHRVSEGQPIWPLFG